MPSPPVFNEAPRSRWSSAPRTIVRPLPDLGDGQGELEMVEIEGTWHHQIEVGPPVPIPGARPIAVREVIAGRLRRTERYGSWIEVSRDVAHSHPELLEWCRRHCNSELPAGGFRFSPATWDACGEETLSLPFVPELDDADETIRMLAGVERMRRETEAEALAFRRWRDELITDASGAGHSRRRLARLLDISFGRVQQIVHGR